MDQIPFETFAQVDLRIGTITHAEPIEGADMLLKLTVDLGPEHGGERTIVAGIAQTHETGSLIGTRVVVVANLEPKMLKGVESNGMVLAVDTEGSIVLLRPEKDVPPGSKIR